MWEVLQQRRLCMKTLSGRRPDRPWPL
ncbi:hypothetical protein P4O66_010516 [Electrophorus voltai]|uniref:Uncharacterized protein n=1 Tax=Electrophorus voltai TaxID=2609070 RepID=A0AAD8ZCC1_9TELE|nr:hypothetical protein P4O66_010516 [Electrophorus voltai]